MGQEGLPGCTQAWHLKEFLSSMTCCHPSGSSPGLASKPTCGIFPLPLCHFNALDPRPASYASSGPCSSPFLSTASVTFEMWPVKEATLPPTFPRGLPKPEPRLPNQGAIVVGHRTDLVCSVKSVPCAWTIPPCVPELWVRLRIETQ